MRLCSTTIDYAYVCVTRWYVFYVLRYRYLSSNSIYSHMHNGRMIQFR